MITPERWQQIERLYHAVLTRDANQREAFLRDACPADDALRHEVESLLAQENGAAGLLETLRWKAMRGIEKANPEPLYGIFGDAAWSNKDRLPDSLLRDFVT